MTPLRSGEREPVAFTLSNGQVDEWPLEATVSRDQALDAVADWAEAPRSESLVDTRSADRVARVIEPGSRRGSLRLVPGVPPVPQGGSRIGTTFPEVADEVEALRGQLVVEVGVRQAWAFLTLCDNAPTPPRETRLYIGTSFPR